MCTVLDVQQRAGHHPDMRERILDAAEACLRRDGFVSSLFILLLATLLYSVFSARPTIFSFGIFDNAPTPRSFPLTLEMIT